MLPGPDSIMPGCLTGEFPADQGIETVLPVFPALHLRPVDLAAYDLRVGPVADSTVRIMLARSGAGVLDDDGTRLEIVTDLKPGAAEVEVTESDAEVVIASSRVGVRVGGVPGRPGGRGRGLWARADPYGASAAPGRRPAHGTRSTPPTATG